MWLKRPPPLPASLIGCFFVCFFLRGGVGWAGGVVYFFPLVFLQLPNVACTCFFVRPLDALFIRMATFEKKKSMRNWLTNNDCGFSVFFFFPPRSERFACSLPPLQTIFYFIVSEGAKNCSSTVGFSSFRTLLIDSVKQQNCVRCSQ